MHIQKTGTYNVALKVFNLANEDSVVKNQMVEIDLSQPQLLQILDMSRRTGYVNFRK